MSRGTLLRRDFFDSRKSKRRKEGMERVIKRAKLSESRNWASRIWEEKCRTRWPSPLSIFPRTGYFSIPLSSPIYPFCRRFNTGGATAEERGVKWFDWAFSISFPSSHVGLHDLRCLPVAYPFFPWRQNAVFLPSRQDVNGIACRTGVIVFFFFFAFCKLARRRAQSMRPARSASFSRG